jgi:hypothetical protein
MTWTGPTYGMWADSMDSMKEFAQAARDNKESAEQWREYAKNLEKALEDLAQKYNDVCDMYINKAGAEAGQCVLKEAALQEIQRLDPSNKMLDKAHRQVIYETEKAALETKLRTK